MAHAAAVAFYTVLSFAPLVLLLATVGGLLGNGAQYELMSFFERQAGPGAGEVAEEVLQTAKEDRASGSTWQWLISTGMLLFTASAVFAQLQLSMNRIWNVEAAPGRGVWRWIRKRLISMGMIVSVLFILLVGLVVSSVLDQLAPEDAGVVSRIVSFLVSLIIYTALFALVYRIMPDVKLAWRDVALGAVVTAILFAIGKFGISMYLDRSRVVGNYGSAAASLIALLIWVYYSSVIVFFGAELTQAYAAEQGRAPVPEEHARPRPTGDSPPRPGAATA